MKKKVYFDKESEKMKGVLGLFLREDGQDIDCAWAGKEFDAFVMTCEENGFTSLQRKRGVSLIFEGMIPKVDFYPVPSLTLFAHDGNGGYFTHGEGDLESPIYFVSKELECWYLAENFRTFVQMVVFEPNWKGIITGERAEVQESKEELENLGMIFGLSFPEEALSEKIHRDEAFEIFENVQKAKEKCTLYEDIWWQNR